MINRDMQRHVESNCATYAGNGRCLLDRPCPFFSDDEGARCPYFESAVLPSDEKLTAKYWARFGLAYWSDGDASKHTKPCNRCGNMFDASDSPKRQYCCTCREEQTREKQNKRSREYRRRKQVE